MNSELFVKLELQQEQKIDNYAKDGGPREV